MKLPYLDHQSYVQPTPDLPGFLDDVEQDEGRDPDQHALLRVVMLYTEEDTELAAYVKENFNNLDKMSGKHIALYAIENYPAENMASGSSAASWLQDALALITNLTSGERKTAFDKSTAYELADVLSVDITLFPCMVLFGSLEQSQKIVVRILPSAAGDYKTFFRHFFALLREKLQAVQPGDSQDTRFAAARAALQPFLRVGQSKARETIAQDWFSQYLYGMDELLARMGNEHPQREVGQTFAQRLRENIAKSRQYGDTETLRSERAEMLSHLDHLAQDVIGVPFDQLCQFQAIETGTEGKQ